MLKNNWKEGFKVTNYRVDLHIHSNYSDGTLSVNEIISAAKEAELRLVAIADHNIIEGSKDLLKKCENTSLKAISAVELDAMDHGRNIHILAYDFDITHDEFVAFIKENRKKLDNISVNLIKKMTKDYPLENFSVASFEAYTHKPKEGGWKALQYFRDLGITKDLYEGMTLYDTYACSYESAGFSNVETVCSLIKKAGGYAVLAHPGITFKNEPLEAYLAALYKSGIEGIECYYPKHSLAVERQCLAFCKEHGLYVTSGSDCHGDFGSIEIGAFATKKEKLALW